MDFDQAWQNVAVGIHIRYQARIIVCECPASQEAWQAGDIRDCKLDRGYAGGENRRWGMIGQEASANMGWMTKPTGLDSGVLQISETRCPHGPLGCLGV